MSAEHIVVGVRLERARDGSHLHVTGVWVDRDGPPYTPRQVGESIQEGEVWKAPLSGIEARLKTRSRCPHPGCRLTPSLVAVVVGGDGEDLLSRLPSW